MKCNRSTVVADDGQIFQIQYTVLYFVMYI